MYIPDNHPKEYWRGKDWQTTNKIPIIYANTTNQLHPCAIQEYFKNNPDKQSVMLVCYCPICRPQC